MPCTPQRVLHTFIVLPWMECGGTLSANGAFNAFGNHTAAGRENRGRNLSDVPAQDTQRTSFHSPHPLRYQVDGSCKETDVPACNIELVIPPHTTFELRVYDTEPRNTTTVSASSEDLSVTLLHQGPLPRHTPDRSPTVRDSLTRVLSVHRLVE